MNQVLWLTAGVLAQAGVGGPAPGPAPAPVSETKGGDGRYRDRRKALTVLLSRIKAQAELEHQLGYVLSDRASKARAEVVRKALKDIQDIAEDSLVLVKELSTLKAEGKDKEALDIHEAVMLHCEEETKRYCEHHRSRLLKDAEDNEEEDHRRSQEWLKTETQEATEHIDSLLAESERAARIREIQLELEVLRRAKEVELDLHHKIAEARAKEVPKVEVTLADRIRKLYGDIR